MKKLAVITSVFCLMVTQMGLAGQLKCLQNSEEVARCNLLKFQKKGQRPMSSSVPVEAVLCKESGVLDMAHFLYKGTETSVSKELLIKKSSNSNKYVAFDWNKNIELTVKEVDSSIIFLETIQGSTIAYTFACTLW